MPYRSSSRQARSTSRARSFGSGHDGHFRIKWILGGLLALLMNLNPSCRCEGSFTGGAGDDSSVGESLARLEDGIEAIHIVGISPANALQGEAEKAGSFGTAFLRG
jgi:hypothetical protein